MQDTGMTGMQPMIHPASNIGIGGTRWVRDFGPFFLAAAVIGLWRILGGTERELAGE